MEAVAVTVIASFFRVTVKSAKSPATSARMKPAYSARTEKKRVRRYKIAEHHTYEYANAPTSNLQYRFIDPMQNQMVTMISILGSFVFLSALLQQGEALSVGGPSILSRRAAVSALSTAAICSTSLAPSAANAAATEDKPKRSFRRYPSIRFISALGDPKSSSGSGSETWGLWRDDPGPRGVYLKDYDRRLKPNNNVAPAGWTFDPSDWWVEEHGLIMSTPEPLPRKSINKETKEVIPEKQYVVTGDRDITTVLTVRDDGTWELEKGSLYDVTHLPCRSAAYRGDTCAPMNANLKDFPVKPGAEMPVIQGCAKQDYAVLFVLGEAV